MKMNDFFDVKSLDDFLFDVEDNGSELKTAGKYENDMMDNTTDTAASSDKVNSVSDKEYHNDEVEEGINKTFIKLATLSKLFNNQKNRI